MQSTRTYVVRVRRPDRVRRAKAAGSCSGTRFPTAGIAWSTGDSLAP